MFWGGKAGGVAWGWRYRWGPTWLTPYESSGAICPSSFMGSSVSMSQESLTEIALKKCVISLCLNRWRYAIHGRLRACWMWPLETYVPLKFHQLGQYSVQVFLIFLLDWNMLCTMSWLGLHAHIMFMWSAVSVSWESLFTKKSQALWFSLAPQDQKLYTLLNSSRSTCSAGLTWPSVSLSGDGWPKSTEKAVLLCSGPN